MLLVADAASSAAQRRREATRRQQAFKRAQRAEGIYSRKLRMVANHIGAVAEELVNDPRRLQAMLREYSNALRPWAEAAALAMLNDVLRRDEAAWRERSRDLSREIHREIKGAPTGDLLRVLMAEQVDLITSLPKDAAKRVHHFAMKTLETGQRSDALVKEIMKTRQVTLSRANLIARTEVGRASTSFVEARAIHVGSEGYIWRTAKDADVRLLHKKLEGTFHRWDEPPVSGENGERSHPGAIYNCRCFPEPVIPDFD